MGSSIKRGRLILTDRNTVLSMDTLADTLTSYKITTGFLTVPLFNRLTEEHVRSFIWIRCIIGRW
ncbi:hypothetical protein ACEQPO_02470 [Bacillus sp. SL00103]